MRAALPPIVLSIALLAPWLAAAPARAQFTAMPQAHGGRTGAVLYTDTAGGQPISRAECEANAPIPVLLTMVPQTTPAGMQATKLDVFWTTTATACQTAVNRTMAAGGTRPCDHVDGAAEDIASRAMFTTANLTPQALFADVNGGSPCTATSTTVRTFFFFAATGEDDFATDFTSWATITIALDPAPPTPPDLMGPIAGDVNIDVTFDPPTAPIYEARLYIDRDGCPDGMTPSSTVLMAGAAPSGTPVATNVASTPASIPVSGTTLGLDYGESAAVAVTFVDRARNESVLSEVICVQRVQVPGFWDSYCSERGLDSTACGARYAACAASPGAGGGVPLAGVALALLALARRRAR